MQIHTLARRTTKTKSKRVGRGGTRGKTSGRGHKGQKAHGVARPAERDVIKKIPKLRGHGKNRARSVDGGAVAVAVVNLSRIENAFSAGETVSKAILKERGLVTRRASVVKVLGVGEISKKLTFEGLMMSDVAKEKIVSAQGTIQ